MNPIENSLLQIETPDDYFRGRGRDQRLLSLFNVLVFIRTHRERLQQEALQNRSHHRFVLALNLETTGQIHVDQRVFTLQPGQALLIHPYQFHHFTRLASDDLKWLFFTFELADAAIADPLRNRVTDVSDDAWDACRTLLEAWHASTSNTATLQEGLVQVGRMRLLLHVLHDASCSDDDDAGEPRDSLVRAVNRFMLSSRGRPVDVADLAKELKLSTSRLRARFFDAAGVPLARYMRNHRLNYAMSLLRTTDLPIAQIAEDAGFGSPQAFSRLFKLKTGNTPRAYRAMPG
jgi:AraC-like DNA-binding protein/quercetin dioxygenase-like cupin family protein